MALAAAGGLARPSPDGTLRLVGSGWRSGQGMVVSVGSDALSHRGRRQRQLRDPDRPAIDHGPATGHGPFAPRARPAGRSAGSAWRLRAVAPSRGRCCSPRAWPTGGAWLTLSAGGLGVLSLAVRRFRSERRRRKKEPVTVGHALWPDLLLDSERAAARPRPGPTRSTAARTCWSSVAACWAWPPRRPACRPDSVRWCSSSAIVQVPAPAAAQPACSPEAHVGADPPFFVDLCAEPGWLARARSCDCPVGSVCRTWIGSIDGQLQARVNPLRALVRMAAKLPAWLRAST